MIAVPMCPASFRSGQAIYDSCAHVPRCAQQDLYQVRPYMIAVPMCPGVTQCDQKQYGHKTKQNILCPVPTSTHVAKSGIRRTIPHMQHYYKFVPAEQQSLLLLREQNGDLILNSKLSKCSILDILIFNQVWDQCIGQGQVVAVCLVDFKHCHSRDPRVGQVTPTWYNSLYLARHPAQLANRENDNITTMVNTAPVCQEDVLLFFSPLFLQGTIPIGRNDRGRRRRRRSEGSSSSV